MLSPHDERVPEQHEIPARSEQPAEVEELRPAVRSVEMMDGHFDDAEAVVLNLLHHLDANDAARFLQVDPLENRAAHQPEITIHVAQGQAEQDADDVMVAAPDDDAVQR